VGLAGLREGKRGQANLPGPFLWIAIAHLESDPSFFGGEDKVDALLPWEEEAFGSLEEKSAFFPWGRSSTRHWGEIQVGIPNLGRI